MAREFKGRSVKCYVKDYTVLDLETTSCFVSDTEIVEISAIKVRAVSYTHLTLPTKARV